MTVNLLPSVNASRIATDTSAWTIHNGTFSSITTTRETGIINLNNASLKCVEGGGNGDDSYVSISVASLTAGLPYTFSAYVKVTNFVAGTISNRGLWFSDGVSGGSFFNITGTIANWTRATGTIVSAAAGVPVVRLYVPDGTTYWADIQLEQSPSASAYVDPGSQLYTVPTTTLPLIYDRANL